MVALALTATQAPSTRQTRGPSKGSQRGLDCLNFFIADVETAFGPFVSVYLAQNGWTQGAIGTALTVNSAVGLALQTPAGALVDWIRQKKLVIVVCLGLIAAGALLIGLFPASVVAVFAGEIMHGVTGGAVRTAIAAIGLGLVGHRAYHTRLGRNHRYNALGNAATALGMGALGHAISPAAPFFVGAGLCVPTYLALWLIDSKEIDYARARGAEGRKEPKAARWRELARNRPLLVLALCLFLFQFANSSMLPLATERLAAEHAPSSVFVTSLLIVVPQFATALLAAWMARKADEWGRKRLLLAAFAALLARTVLFAVVFSPWFLVTVQVLDGLSAAVIGILFPLIVADLTKGTGRYNFALGAVAMLSTLGATISTVASGFFVQYFGFGAGFGALAIVAGLGVATVGFLMPETVGAAREPVAAAVA